MYSKIRSFYPIINSDDFGLDEQTNFAIFKSLQDGLINSTSFLVNFSEGFSHALELYHYNKQVFPRIGIHLNLTEGKPITSDILNNNSFCNGNTFHGNFSMLNFNQFNLNGVKKELEAQIVRLLDSGIAINHIDSHHHIHTQLPILFIVIKLAKKYNIKEVRLARNIGSINNFKIAYKLLVNKLIKFNNLSSLKFFGDLNDLNYHLNRNRICNLSDFEIMVHSRFKDKILLDLDQQELAKKIQLILN